MSTNIQCPPPDSVHHQTVSTTTLCSSPDSIHHQTVSTTIQCPHPYSVHQHTVSTSRLCPPAVHRAHVLPWPGAVRPGCAWGCAQGRAAQEKLHTVLHTAHYILHTMYCALHILYCTLHALYFTLHTARPVLHTNHYIMHIAHNLLNTQHCIGTAHCILNTAHPALNSVLFTANFTCYRGEFTKTNCSPKCIHFGEQQNRLKTLLNIRFGEPINTLISWFRENIRFGDTQIHWKHGFTEIFVLVNSPLLQTAIYIAHIALCTVHTLYWTLCTLCSAHSKPWAGPRNMI